MKDMINGKRPSLKFNALSNLTSLVINVVTGLYMMRIVMRGLDPTSFGMWMLTSSVVGYFSLLQMGVGTGVMRYVPLYRGQGRLDDVSMTVSTAMAFYTLAGLMILASSWLLADVIASFFAGGPTLSQLIWIVGLAAALECPSYIYDAALRSYERFVLANVVLNLKAFVKAFVTWWCLHLGYGVVGLSWSLVTVNVVMLILADVMFRFACREVKLRISSVKFSEMKVLSGYSVWIAIGSIGDTLTFGLAKAIIGKLISLNAVGTFGVVAQLSNYYRRTTYAITKPFMPRFSFLQGRENHSEIQRLFVRATSYITIFTGLIAVFLWALGPAFMKVVFDKDLSSMVPVLAVLVGGMLVLGSNRMVIDLLYGLGKQRALAWFAMCEGISVLALSLGLVQSVGILGVAIGTSAPVIVMRGIVQPYYACRLMQMSLGEYYGRRIVRLWIIIGGFSGVLVVLKAGTLATNWFNLIVASAAVAFMYLAIVYLVALDNEERRDIIRQVVSRFKKRTQTPETSPVAEEAI
jgi:O-antigen/teichoic acid export membrane protein